MPKASVKVMLSYNYCHFEVALSSDQEMTLKEINEMRKDAQKLANHAIEQYRTAKMYADVAMYRSPESLKAEAGRICTEVPEAERNPAQKAIVKLVEEENYRGRYGYDDEDEF